MANSSKSAPQKPTYSLFDMAKETTQTPLDVFIGRQPIYDGQLKLHAHELLFRSSQQNSASFEAADKATSQLLIHSMLDIGFDQIAGERPVFVNLPQVVILNGLANVLPADRCILEILETVVFTPEVLRALGDLKSRGYRIALDDYIYCDGHEAVLELADYVKLDIRVMSSDRLKRQLGLVKKYPVATLAEKIETLSEFRLCQHLGFDYFQGYFLSRPEIVPGKSPVVDILAMTLLVERCQDPMADISGIARLVAQNASLSYRLLQAANSAMHGRVTEISSVKEAVRFLGLGFVSKLASLFLLSGLGDKPSSVLVLALQRACMCEVLAADDSERNQLYLVGLLSALDFLLGQQIDSIIEPLPLSDEVKTAIVGRQGRLGKVLAGVVAYESQDWTSLEVDSEDAAAITRAYWSVLPQVEQMRSLIETICAPGAGTTTNGEKKQRRNN